MAGTSTTESKPAAPKPAAPKSSETRPAAAPVPAAEAAPEPVRVESDCVVDSGFHVGHAVNGKVCSYHAMHYDAAGKRRK